MTILRRVHTTCINHLSSTVNTDYAHLEVYAFTVTTSILQFMHMRSLHHEIYLVSILHPIITTHHNILII
jgi:hypothetical protein